MPTQTLLSTITTKGQLTIPVAIRRRLGLRDRDQIAFVIDEAGRVELQVPRYSTVASVAGAVPALKKPMSWQEMRDVAREDHLLTKHAEDDDSGHG
jgi:AbrB family looped-hinge helix DNA binding protein